MIGIVASIAGVVTLLSILIAVYLFLQRRQRRRTHRMTQQKGVEGGPGLTERGVPPPLDPQSAHSPGSTINIINKPTPYPMEKYTSAPISPDFVQSTPNNHAPDRYQQMRSLNAATADLDRILHTSVLTLNGDTKAWSSTLSPSTPHSRGVQSSEPSFGTREQPRATIPISPLSFTSNFGDLIIPVNYVRTGVAEAEPGIGGGRDHAAARRSSMTVTIHGQDAIRREG